VLKNLFAHARTPIGVDFGAHSIKMLQLECRNGKYVAVAAACEPIGADLPSGTEVCRAALIQIIRKMLGDSRFAGIATVSCLPSSAIQYKNIRLPRMPAEELRAAVEWEATDRLHLSPDKTRVQYFDAGEVRQGEELRAEVILLAASVPHIDEQTGVLTGAGLSPQCVESVPSALARAIRLSQTNNMDEDGIQVVLDVGYSSSKALIVRNGRVMFFKSIEIGGKTLDEGVGQRLGLPIAEAAALRRRLQATDVVEPQTSQDQPLFGDARRETIERAVYESLRSAVNELGRELSLCLRYFSVTFRGRRPETVLLVGGEAYEAQLPRLLADCAGIAVEPLNLGQLVDFSRVCDIVGARDRWCEWGVAAGLAMWQPGRSANRGAA